MKKEIEELTGYIYNNQDNDNFKIMIKIRTYNLKKAKRKLDRSHYTQN